MGNRYLEFVKGSPGDRRRMAERRLRRWRSDAQVKRLSRQGGPRGDWAFVDGSLRGYRESYLVSRHDRYIGKSLLYGGAFEFDKLELALALLERSGLQTLVDVGANIGSTCIPAVARGLAARAVALEPDPVNFTLLRANVLINGLTDRIECHEAAAASVHADMTLEFDSVDRNFGAHSIAPREGAVHAGRELITVAGHRLDEHTSGLDPATDLVWIDAEGYEFEILTGATYAVGSGVPVVMEFTPHLYRRHTSLADGLPLLSRYRRFWDLANPGASRPLGELVDLESTLGEAGYTDVLVVA